MKGTLKRAAFSISLAVLIAVTIGSIVCAHAQNLRPFNQSPDFAVEFSDCVESIGVTLVPTASARAYVPNQFILAGEGQPVTPLVVRTARCGILRRAWTNARRDCADRRGHRSPRLFG